MFTGRRIKLARELQGFTISDLAELSGISAKTISGYEKGTVADTSNISKIAAALKVAPKFFEAEDDTAEISTLSFRRSSKVRTRDTNAAKAAAKIAAEMFDVFESKFTLPQLDLPEYFDDTPSDAAEFLRREWKLGYAPINSLLSLLESKGIRVFSLDTKLSEIDAFCFTHEGNAYICLNQDKTTERKRFDLAHELGHLVLGHGSAKTEEDTKELERQANEFASAFLMPADSIKTQICTNPNRATLLEAKTYWQVSATAFITRLKQLNIITDWQYRQQMIDLSRDGYRKAEPDSELAEEQSVIYTTLLSHTSNKLLSTTADAVGVTEMQLNKLVGSLAPLVYVNPEPDKTNAVKSTRDLFALVT